MKNVKKVKVNSAVYENIKLAPAAKVWIKKNGKYKLNTDKYNFIGKIEKNNPHIVQKAYVNEIDNNNKTSYVDDFSALPKVTKKSVIDYLLNGKSNKKQKVYLVQGKRKSIKSKKEIN